MDKLAAMHAFVEIVDRGSLTAAGKALDRSLPTMVRTLAELEQALGAKLLRRTTRRMSLTDEGRGYLERCRRILADVGEAEQFVGLGRGEMRGDLRVTAPVLFGQRYVAPAVVSFLRLHPDVHVDLLLLDRVVDLVEEGIDVGVRIGRLADSSMIAVPVGSMRRVLCASPALIGAAGPRHPEDLAAQPCVRFRGLAAGEQWRFREGKREVAVPITGRFVTNQAAAAVAACTEGLGFGLFLHYQVAAELEDGRLQLVLEDYEPEPSPVSLVYADARLPSARQRAFLDTAKRDLRRRLEALA